MENPLHFPIGTFVIFAPSVTHTDLSLGTVSVDTQSLGSAISVITSPVGYVETLRPNTPVLSSFDPATAQTFGTKPQFTSLQVVEPQIGGSLLVLDPDTGNYAYVNAADVGPAGPPAAKVTAAVAHDLLAGT